MRMNNAIPLIFLLCLLATSTPILAQPVQSPLAFTMDSIKRGKSLYASHCAICHGADGNGDTQMREFLKTHPANLIDEQWTYGSSDGEIFHVIKHGRTDRDMEAFENKLSDERIWLVINYIRYMGGKRPE